MFVTRVIGKCPGCGTEASYGNVNISQNILLRGCSQCQYSEDIPLPPLSKAVLYLDQFFFSHAFRANVSDFVDATQFISKLAHEQLLVCPYSRTHEVETQQWTDPQRHALLDFIKHTSRGQEFEPHYDVKRYQILKGFQRFLDSDRTGYELKRSDALPHDINEWEDYFRIDVGRPPDDIEKIREMKERSVEELIALFSTWRSDSASFEEDHVAELVDARKYYVRIYLEKIKRLAQYDFMAIIDSPVDTLIVESMLYYDDKSMSFKERLRRITEFFFSPYFSEVPYEAISSGLFAVLRKRVRQGHYQNPERAKERLRGFFYDIEFIATYAPYCNAVILDKVMMDFVNDPDLRLSQRYGTRFFSRNNWAEFLEYLREIESSKTKELEWVLRAVHPKVAGQS